MHIILGGTSGLGLGVIPAAAAGRGERVLVLGARLMIRRDTARGFLWMCIIQIKWSGIYRREEESGRS